MELEDLEDLINLRVTHKERSFLDEFSEDAADCPHVDAQGVLLLTQKDFWSSVPKSLNFMGQGLDWDGESSRKSEITDFEIALVGDKDVLRFEVSVEDPVGVHVVNS